ncbi:DEAD/DEAH box helicase [Thalassotalea sp. M1531]|uniref:DEAD-box ATP-dependent RNA helicase RhpA n=1 Tax=Thalassotalea algicola TaxID=2716224 RepID=A0A7Y0Q8S7_9GAMM|nr:DEAD/DEAH box helicase [Thalassotalea algicola]NMP33227.1 DEAD/DEAH box helicase [Thalassotalea algicola]
MPFSKLGLSEPVLKAIAELGYSEPTTIQKQAIPVALNGKDLIAAAQTGTGKTASFVLPILERLNNGNKLRGKRIQALVLTPTRELAVQVEQNIANYGKYLELSSMAMYGGVDSTPQKQALIWGVNILVATPGRLLDMVHQRALHFDELKVLVLDEADRMLDMGFIDDINKIIKRLPIQRQNLLFSATISPAVRALAKRTINDAVEIATSQDKASKPQINQWLVTVDKSNKSALLSHLIKEQQWQQALIFIETKHGAAKLVSQLEKRGIKAESIHGGRTQANREQILADFKSGKITMLVSTGIAARGIDIGELTRVVNYDLPAQADEYIHRIGRTGRAGATGEAISLVSKDNFRELCAIESRLGHIIERKEFEGFPVKKVVPISILDYVPKHKRQ